MIPWVLLVTGVVLGGVTAWLAANSKSKGILAEVRQQAGNLQTNLDAKEREIGLLQQEAKRESEEKIKAQTQLQVLQDAEKSLANVFDSLADKALKSNNQAF